MDVNGDVRIRPARLADVEQVLELWQVAGENADRPVDTPDAVVALLARDPDALLLACRGDEIVGSLIAGWDGWRASLYRLAVRPDCRRQGLAGRLLDAALVRFTDLGALRAAAMVLADNADGQAFWRSAGFEPQQQWRRWVRGL